MKRLIVAGVITLGCLALVWQFARQASTPDAGSGEISDVGGDVIAIVDGEPILRSDWDARVGDVSPQQSRRLLEAEVRRMAVLAAAEDAGYAEREEVRQRVEASIVALYLNESVAAKLDAIEVSDAELDAHLADNPVASPQPLRRAAILRHELAEGEDDGQVQELLLSAREEALALTGPIPHFGPVAARLSDHRATRARGGVLGYFKSERAEHDSIPAAVHSALWQLAQPGDISGVVADDGALYLVRFVDEHLPAGQDLASQRALIRDRMLMEKRRVTRQALFDEIENRVGVVIAPDWQAQPAEPAPQQPPASPIAQAVKSPENVQ